MRMHTIPQNVSAYQDRIVGSLIGKQFVYLAIGGVIVLVLVTTPLGPALIRIPIAFIIGLFSVALALFRPNDRPFDEMFFGYTRAILGPTEWAWGKEPSIPPQLDKVLSIGEELKVPTKTTNSLKDTQAQKRRQAQHYQRLMAQRRLSGLDDSDINFIDQLDFSLSVPQKVFTTTKDQTSAPPMLTPHNYQQAQATPQPEVVKRNFTVQDSLVPLAGVGTNRLNYIAADNNISLGNSIQPQTNRTLSRQALTKASLVMPVRGEIKIPISPQTQQNLTQIIAQQQATPIQQAANTSTTQTPSPKAQAQVLTPSQSQISILQSRLNNQTGQSSPQHGITNQTTTSSTMNQSPDPQQLNQPTENQPQGEYEATFGTSDRQYYPVAEGDNQQLGSQSQTTPQQPTDNPLTLNNSINTPSSVSYNQPSAEHTPNLTNKVSETDANSIENALSGLEQQANQINDPNQPSSSSLAQQQSATDSTGKFNKFTTSQSQSLPTIDPNMANLPINNQPVTNASDNSSYTPLPVNPVLNPTVAPTSQTTSPNNQPPVGEPAINPNIYPPQATPTPTTVPTVDVQPPVDNQAAQVVQQAPTLASKQVVLTQEPNIINGRVIDAQGQSVPGVIIVVKNELGEAKRALKTNKLGQFIVTTPLTNGTYTVEVDKKGFNFDIIQVQLTGMVLPAIDIHAK